MLHPHFLFHCVPFFPIVLHSSVNCQISNSHNVFRQHPFTAASSSLSFTTTHFSIFDLLHQFFFTVRWIVQNQRIPHVFQQHAFTPSFSSFNHGQLARKRVTERDWPKIQYAGMKDNHMSMSLMEAWLSNYMKSYVQLLIFKDIRFFLLLKEVLRCILNYHWFQNLIVIHPKSQYLGLKTEREIWNPISNLCMVDSAIHRLEIGLQNRYLDYKKIKLPCTKTIFTSLQLSCPSCAFFPNFSSLPSRFSNSRDSHKSSNNTLSPPSPLSIAPPWLIFPSSTFYTNFSSLLSESSKSKKSNIFFHITLSPPHSPPPATAGKKASSREILAQKTICRLERQSYIDAVKKGVWLPNYISPYVQLLTFNNFCIFIFFSKGHVTWHSKWPLISKFDSNSSKITIFRIRDWEGDLQSYSKPMYSRFCYT